MNGLSDSVTIGIVITLVFGALFFYLYSRLTQNEKRVSLIENILLDLKMSADAGWGVHGMQNDMQNDMNDEQPMMVNHVEPVSAPEPLEKQDVDSNEEDMYKEILAQTSTHDAEGSSLETKTFEIASGKSQGKSSVQVTKVQPNYEAMSLKELKSLAKQRGVSIGSQSGKKEIIGALRKADGGAPTPAPNSVEAGSFLGTQEGAMLDGELEAETL